MHTQTMAIVGALSGALGGGLIGFFFGRRLRLVKARKRFWVASGASLAIGMLVIFLGRLVAIDFLAGLGVGLMSGGLNGLRWGMGRLSDAPRPEPERMVPGEIERRGELVPEDHAQQPPVQAPPVPPSPGDPASREEHRTPTPVH